MGAPEDDEIEIVVTGMCVAVDDSQSQNSSLSETPQVLPTTKTLLKPGYYWYVYI